MLRKGFKCAKALQAVANVKSLAKVPKFALRSHHVSMTNAPSVQKKVDMYNLIGEKQSSTAWIVLNRDHKYNTLSDGFMTDIKRFMQSYESDEIITGVWFQNQGTVFSKGMDLKYILHKMANNEANQAYEYLRQVYDFSMFYGSYMKPMMTILDGELNNAGASIFIQRPHLITTPKTTWALNETGLGYIPDAGSTHFLSRLPNEIGTYLAMTGRQLCGKELRALKLVHNYTEESIVELRKDFIQENTRRNRPHDSQNIYGHAHKEAFEKSQEQEEESNELFLSEFSYRVGQRGENPKMVLAELKYRREAMEHANSYHEKFKGMTAQDEVDQKLINHTMMFEEALVDFVLPNQFNQPTILPYVKINKCFKGKTVEEIFKALEEDGSTWAEETLEILKTKSPMSLKLTLRLLREGLGSQWGECFQREYRVACRRFGDEEFQRALEAKIVNGKPEFNGWTYKTLESITPEMVDRYFAPLEQDLKVAEYQPFLPTHSLAPIKDYYQVYPDMFRYWINKQTIRDFELRSTFEFDVRAFTKKLGINIRNPMLNHDLVRDRVYKSDASLKRSMLQLQRVYEIAQSPSEVKSYYDTRIRHIEEFFKDERKAQKYIHDTMTTVFEEAFEKSMKRKSAYATNARKFEKKKVFEKIREAIKNGRMTRKIEFQPVQLRRLHKLAQNFSIPLFFPSNSAESYLDVPNPDITPLHPYAKYVDNIKLTRKFDHEYYENFVNGVIGEEEYTQYLLEKDLPKEVGPAPTNLEKAYRAVYREMDYIKLEKKQKDLELNWGPEPTEIERKERNYKDFLEMINQNHEDISKALKSDPALKDYVKKTFMTDTMRQKGDDVEIQLEHIVPVPDYAKFEEHSQWVTENLPKTDETLDSFINTVNFLDLQPERLNPKEAQTIYARGSTKPTLGTYEEQLFEMLKLDDVLKTCLDPIYGEQSKATKSFADFFRNILANVYKKKVDAVLNKEQMKYQNVRPLFTNDGASVLVKGTGLFEGAFMETIDDYLAKNSLFEFNRYVSAHTFFTFGFLALLELEKLYNGLGKIVVAAQRGPLSEDSTEIEGDFSAIAKFLKEKHINIANKEDFGAVLEYLNRVTACASQLFHTYKDQLHFTEDILLDKYVKIRYTMTRYNTGLRNRKNFIHTVLENFKSQQEVLQELDIQNMDLEPEHYYPKPNQDAFKTALLTYDEIKDQNIEVLDNAINATATYFAARNNTRTFIPGVANYLVDLEKATKSAIYGKFNAFPTEYHFTDEEVVIPEYFDRFDLREPLDVWFDKKLKEVLDQYMVERSKFQEILTTEELIALDQDLMRLLTPENIKEAMIGSFDNDMSLLNYHGSMFDTVLNAEHSVETQFQKAPVVQKEFNKSVKNPDALNRYVTFAITLYEKYKKKSQKGINTLLIGVRRQMLDRMYKEAFDEPSKLPSMDEFTQGQRMDANDLKQAQQLEELRTLKEHNIDKNTAVVMHAFLEELSQKETRKPDLRKDLEYLFKRHDISKDTQM